MRIIIRQVRSQKMGKRIRYASMVPVKQKHYVSATVIAAIAQKMNFGRFSNKSLNENLKLDLLSLLALILVWSLPKQLKRVMRGKWHTLSSEYTIPTTIFILISHQRVRLNRIHHRKWSCRRRK